jgi:3-hydroxybutyrate dehydrogenase
MKLENQVVIVTGAGSGIGRQIALSFGREGCRVAVCDIDVNGARETAAALGKTAGAEAMVVEMDVTDEKAVNAGVDKVAAKWGRIDTLVSNAGIQIVHPIETFPFADFKKLVSIHLDGAFLTTKACVKHMYKEKRGSLIYMGSVHSHEASPLKSAYVAAKHGIAGFTKTVALETATFGITANAICPGYVWTPLVERQIPDTMAARGLTRDQVINDVLLAAQPTKQFVTVEEVAALAVYLAGDMARSVTGSIISIDGGWTAA